MVNNVFLKNSADKKNLTSTNTLCLVSGPILCEIENEKRHFSIWIFRSEEKKHLLRSDFGDFRAAVFDLAFPIATSFRNGGDRKDGDRKILRDKIPRRVHDSLTKTKTNTPQTVQDITNQVMRSSARRRYKATNHTSCRDGLRSNLPASPGRGCLGCSA